ncbi:ribonuclease J [Candidatus Parcubacteria bacterium]|jgi:ribonuclease J|nr:ribonuclease J [Candidatus Parcubacteria bacterium]MBT3948926.1 ribonuclease J [Candidatus Parcubacteria bacterium]
MNKQTRSPHTPSRHSGGAQRKRRTYSSQTSSHAKTSTAKPVKKSAPQTRKRRQTRSYNTSSSSTTSKNLRIIPLGGCEEVGRNMTVFEYDGDIVILDMGIQFPEEDMPGIDYIIPNTRYLQGKEKNIKGVVFSHGHLDHIGAAPILLEKLGNPTIVGRDLTLALIKHKQDDYKKGTANKLKTIRIKGIKDVLKMGKFTIRFFQVEHSIMDAVGVIIETPNGTVIHPGDWTLERDEKGKATVDYSHLGKLRAPTVLMLESLGVMHEHGGGSYEEMYKNLQNILAQAPGRIIIGTFSSQLERIKWVLDAAQKLGKKVALDGYSMKMNVEMARKLGYIKINKSVLIDIRHADKYPENKLVVMCTGAQGEENAVLMRIVNKQHRTIELRKKDTVIFSSSVIPGNERSIQRLKDNIYRQCDNVIHGEIMDVHVSGHATRDDILEMIRQINPTYFIPVYANHYFLKEARKLAIENGFSEKKVFVPDNGTVIEVNRNTAKVLAKKVPSDYVFVDGLGVSDTQNIVIRDRQALAEDGMIVVIATVDTKSGKLIQNPDIISRGFVFLKDNKELIEDIRHKVKHLVIKSDPLTWADTNQIRNNIRDKIGQFVFSKTEKRPMILPVVIEV